MTFVLTQDEPEVLTWRGLAQNRRWRMTEYTKEQVAAAARLVPEYAAFFHYSDGEVVIVRKGSMILWQPWADTEAGRSDALVLLAAVQKWMSDDDMFDDSAVEHWNLIDDPLMSGSVQQIQQATMAAAIAIGQHKARSGQEG